MDRNSDRWLCKGSLSVNQFETEQELGSYHLKPSDISYKARFDADGDLDDRHHLFAGAECEKMTNRFEGTVPMNPMVLDPAASTYLLDEEQSAVRVGVYAELESRVSQRMTANLGTQKRLPWSGTSKRSSIHACHSGTTYPKK